MFKTRLLSGIILVALALILIISGGEILLVSTAMISMIGQYELYRVFHVEKKAPGFLGYLFTAFYFADLEYSFLPDLEVAVIVFLILLLAVFVFSFPKYKADQIMAAFFGIFYVSIMLSFIYQTRMIDNGAYIVWLIFLCSWGCDTCAYCVGVLLGKHKMAPILSPKKSVEGAIGGVCGAFLLTLLYSFIFRAQMGVSLKEMLILGLISAVGGLISMVGDLAASAIKRNYEIKDYGTLIPGHGGILDRFDSVIITAPIIYYLAVYLVA